jgi:hypothetical protein
LNEELIINGQRSSSFKTLLPKTEKAIEDLFSADDFSVMHGDFCFNNILYDSYSGTIRLIDPREVLVKIFQAFMVTLNMILQTSSFFCLQL